MQLPEQILWTAFPTLLIVGIYLIRRARRERREREDRKLQDLARRHAKQARDGRYQ